MRSLKPLLFVSCVVVFLSETVNSYRILGIFPHVARSHYIMADSLMRGLAAKGHDVTLISPYNPSESSKNYRTIHLERTLSDAEGGNFVHFNDIYFPHFLRVLYDWNVNFTISAMKSVNLQQFMQNREQFDVVIYQIYICDALIGLGHYFGAPVIGFSTLRASKWTSDITGLSDFASHNPNYYNGFTDQMTFWQRMYNSLSYWYEDLMLHLYYYPTQQKLFDELFRNVPDMPTYTALRRNISLVFVNSHVSFGIPQPMPPNLIEIGGIHVKTIVETLTEEIQSFLDGAINGAIYFSLGSTVELAKLPLEQKQMIANAFGEFPHHRFLIKCKGDFAIPTHDPSNVLIRQWFNQEAILSHPNVKIFITHGGLFSTTEAVHFSKPIIGISVFFDQSFNMKLAEQLGYGIHIPYGSLSEQNLKSAIRHVLTNSSYSETVRKISDRFHDQLNTPMDRAIHWVEHVARHKGSLYMQSSGVQLPFHVYYNLDVWAFIMAGVVVTSYLLWKIILVICCANEKRSTNKQKLN